MKKRFQYGLILLFAAGVAHAESSATNKMDKAVAGSHSFAVSGKKAEKKFKPAELTSYNPLFDEKKPAEKQNKKEPPLKKPVTDQIDVVERFQIKTV